MVLSQQLMNLLVIAAEIGLLIIAFFLINLLLKKISLKVAKRSRNPRLTRKVKNIYRTLQFINTLIFGFACAGILAVNSWLIYQGENLKDYSYQLIQNTPSSFWEGLVWGLGKSLGLLGITAIANFLIRLWLRRLCERAKKFEDITANDASIDILFIHLRRGVCYGLWFLAIIQSIAFLGGTISAISFLLVLFRIYGIITVGFICSKLVPVIIDSLDALSQKYRNEEDWLRFYDSLRHLTPFLARCVEYAIYVTTVTFVVREVEAIATWAPYGPKFVKIIGIILIARILIEVSKLLIEDLIFKNQDLSESQSKRRRTIVPLLHSIFKYFIYFGSTVSVLYALEIDPTPILAAAGILGLAASLGAQNLINDIVCGFFILFENYYLVGDYIETGSAEGYVEAIELRTTRIRDLDGQQYIIRNGDVGQITNFSKQYVNAIVKVGVAYESDLNHVIQVLESVGRELAKINPDVLAPTVVQGVDDFGESDMVIRMITRVKPGKHPPVKRMLRKMIKEAFDQENIEIPYARRVLIQQNEGEADRVI